MITLTAEAAKQIRHSAVKGKMENLALRLAATREPDNSLHYAMGFDDVPNEKDHRFSSEGVELVVSETSVELLRGAVVDYVEIEPGKHQFIFLNPNDPNYKPPNKDHSKDAGGDNP